MCNLVLINGVKVNKRKFVMPSSTSNVAADSSFELHLDAAKFEKALAAIYEKHRKQVREDDLLDPSDHDALTEANYPDFGYLSNREDVMLLVFEDHLYSEFANAFNCDDDSHLYQYYLKEFTGYRKQENVHIFSGICQNSSLNI